MTVLNGYEQVNRNWTGPFSSGAVYDFYVDCPSGKLVLGGGFDASNGGNGAGPNLLASWPSAIDGEPRRWNIRVQPTTQLDYVTVFATCAS